MTLTLIIIFLVLFIISLFFSYSIFISKTTNKSENVNNFSLNIDILDLDFEEKVDNFIKKYIEEHYSIEVSSNSYKEIYKYLKNNQNMDDENLKIIDKIFSLLIVNKYTTSKKANREEIIQNINSLEK